MNIKGIVTALVTPINQHEEINYEETTKLIEFLIDKKVNGLFILGTNGETHALSNQKALSFAKHVVKMVGGRIPIIAGVGKNSTKATITFAQQMENEGVDALSVITPFFIPNTQDELIYHYTTISSNVNLPIYIYNMPSKTGVNIEPETLKKLSDLDNIVGIKDSSGSLENMKQYIDLTKDNSGFVVFSGSDSKILDVLEYGGAGGVTSISNALPSIMVGIYENWKKGNKKQASYFQESIEEFRAVVKKGTIPSILKAYLNENQLLVGPTIKPVAGPDEETLKEIRKVSKHYKELTERRG